MIIKYENYQDKVAIVYRDKKYSYRDLQKMINRIKCAIAEYGNNINTVAIYSDRSPYVIAAIWALWEMNIAFVLLDPMFPKARIKEIIFEGNVDLVLVSDKFNNSIKEKKQLVLDNICLEYVNTIVNEFEGQNIAYIVFTSGSTGKPKGIKISRNNLLSYYHGISKCNIMQEDLCIASFSSISFDIFLMEAMLPLVFGMTIYIADEEEKRNINCIKMLLQNVDILQATPSFINWISIVDSDLSCFCNIKTFLIGGENFSSQLLKLLKNKTTGRIYNLYGPSETTIWATISDVTYMEKPDLGVPIGATEITIDVEQKDKGRGELIIWGDMVGEGYTDQALNELKFIKGKAEKRGYRTGDLVEVVNDKIFFVGRMDNQVKIKGYRIELEEVENVIGHIISINNIMCCKINENLVAGYCDENLNLNLIKDVLKETLPSYMLPSKYVFINDFVYSINGKIDRYATSKKIEAEVSNKKNGFSDINFDITEMIISVIYQMQEGDLDINKSFGENGFDSFSFVQLIVKLEDKLGIELNDDIILDSQNFIYIVDFVNEIVKRISRKSHDF